MYNWHETTATCIPATRAPTAAPMMPDAEVIAVATEALDALPIGPFNVKLNHRRLLDAVLDLAGVPAAKFKPACSAIDKLDKELWEAVRRELIEDKGIDAAAADTVGRLVQLRGVPRELLARLRAERTFGSHAGAAAALDELELLFKYLEGMGALTLCVARRT